MTNYYHDKLCRYTYLLVMFVARVMRVCYDRPTRNLNNRNTKTKITVLAANGLLILLLWINALSIY